MAEYSTAIIVDGVHKAPENGIKVIIVGAGVSGLQAALECSRKGCDVVVLEKTENMSPLGKLSSSIEHRICPPSSQIYYRGLFYNRSIGLDHAERVSEYACRLSLVYLRLYDSCLHACWITDR